jgi:alkylation response protein AidB-like acyl-CoA dehydrogenase
MAQLVADRRDVDFVLHEQLNVADLSKHKSYAEFNKKTVDLIISEARNLAVKELLPIQIDGDREGARFESGNVTVPDSFHKAWDLFKEGEWVALSDDPELGGQGMPVTLSLAVNDYFIGANFAFMMYPGLTHGAGRLIQTFGTAKQKKLFLKKMFTGEWTGTMLLTEPEAGSDVGALTTSAVKNDDGTYSITGNKIFISSGEHDMAENIIHPVLARIEGAPQGTKGISLFLVPKIRVNDDGSLGEFNDVVCTGVEEKLGIHGNATCSLSLGSKGNCQGTLLGEKNKGMRAMFQMMNEARLLVGLQGLACASAAYLYAVNYAQMMPLWFQLSSTPIFGACC